MRYLAKDIRTPNKEDQIDLVTEKMTSLHVSWQLNVEGEIKKDLMSFSLNFFSNNTLFFHIIIDRVIVIFLIN